MSHVRFLVICFNLLSKCIFLHIEHMCDEVERRSLNITKLTKGSSVFVDVSRWSGTPSLHSVLQLHTALQQGHYIQF